SIQIISASAQARTNAFSIADYNKYNGAYLTTSDKEEILNKIPAAGLDLNLASEGGAISVSYHGFAAFTQVIGGGRGWLAKDPLELALMGNSVGERVDAAGTDGDGWAAYAIGISHGKQLISTEALTLSGGITIKYLRGLSYYGIDELVAEAVTELTGLYGDGGLTALEATGGSGYAIDLGWSADYRQTSYSLAVTNLLANINWDRGATEHVYNFTLDNLTVENAGDDTVWNSEEIVIPGSPFSTRPPLQLELSAARYFGRWLTSAALAQGFEDTPFTSASLRVALGTEYQAFNWLALRSGVAGGGDDKISLALGLGLGFGPWRFDFGYAAASRLLPWGGTGGTVAISSYLDF
ncbi:MAG: hypothetical protein ABIJ61_06145, partial [bacterium]